MWVWPKDVDAVRSGLYGYYGADFDAGIDRLMTMITRYDEDPFSKPKRRAVANGDIASCAIVLVALSNHPEFSAGVIAMTQALLPGREIAYKRGWLIAGVGRDE